MNLEQIVVYGVPLALLVNVVMGIVEFYFPAINSKISMTIKATLGVAGFLFAVNAPSLEELFPIVGDIAQQAIASIIVFATLLGLTNPVGLRVRTFLASRK